AFIRGKLHTYCYIEDCLCKMVDDGQDDQKALEQLRADIIFDYRAHLLRRRCESCLDNPCDGDGVPLARVWVWDRRDPGCVSCNVVLIESGSPYRRPIGGPCDDRLVSAGFHIMQPAGTVALELQRSGITAKTSAIPSDEDPLKYVDPSAELSELQP